MNAGLQGNEITDISIKPNDIYWSIPRRVWIRFSELQEDICDLSGEYTKTIKNIYIKENGTNYNTQFTQHPLIPYASDTDGVRPIKLNRTGINYGDWLSIVGSQTASPVLREHIRREIEDYCKIFVCGYLVPERKQ